MDSSGLGRVRSANILSEGIDEERWSSLLTFRSLTICKYSNCCNENERVTQTQSPTTKDNENIEAGQVEGEAAG